MDASVDAMSKKNCGDCPLCKLYVDMCGHSLNQLYMHACALCDVLTVQSTVVTAGFVQVSTLGNWM